MRQDEQNGCSGVIFVPNTTTRALTVRKETNMATSTQGGSATIYQFPARGRLAASTSSSETKPYLVSPPTAPVVDGSGWYHEEAIEAERTRRN